MKLYGISKGMGGLQKNPFCGGGMDNLWNYTMVYKLVEILVY